MEEIKSKIRNYNIPVKCTEKIICDDILVHIIKFNNLRDLALQREVSRQFYTIIEEDKNIVLNCLDLSTYEKEINLKWLKNFIKNKYIKKLNLLLCEDFIISRDIIFLINAKHIEQLKISVNIFLEGKEIIHFKNLKSITIKNMFFNETGEEENKFMVDNLMKMPWIEEIKLNNIKYMTAEFFKYLTNRKITLIDFRESIKFTIDDMESFIQNHKNNLRVLRIDGEYSSQQIIEKNLHLLVNLNELNISYCENFNDSLLYNISKICFRLRRLSLRKLRNVSENCLSNFVKESSFLFLEKLDLYDCPLINTSFLLNLSYKAPNLKFLDISWSNCVKNESVISIINNCVVIEKLYLQGCKFLDENLFSSFRNNKVISGFKSLKLVDFAKCDMIHDKIMTEFTILYKGINFINYFGNLIK